MLPCKGRHTPLKQEPAIWYHSAGDLEDDLSTSLRGVVEPGGASL